MVLGASGYSGAEVARILVSHPAMEVTGLGAHSRAGGAVVDVLPHLTGGLKLAVVPVTEVADIAADVCFSCLPSGGLEELLGSVRADVVVDLADDYRIDPQWTYGLTELTRERVRSSKRIANPGCYPTATLLCLVPFARAGLIEGPVIVDALSGVSGAGRRQDDHLLFGELAENAAAYGSVEHRHVPEMERYLAELGGMDTSLSFTPHLVPMARGVLVTARARLKATVDDEDALSVLRQFYADEPFVEVIEDWPKTKALTGTNRAHVSARVDARNRLLICSTAIDNLGKGAAGQAVQNANVALGIEETTGLGAYGVWP